MSIPSPTTPRPRSIRQAMPRSRLMLTVAGLVSTAALAAGCSGGYGSGTPANSSQAGSGSGVASSSGGIPQNNGCDHDADNNGGPSDGDGNI
jgi:hypothetical protein